MSTSKTPDHTWDEKPKLKIKFPQITCVKIQQIGFT